MPRKSDPMKDLQRTRRDNYVFHFECRKYFETLPDGVKGDYLKVAAYVGQVQLTVTGGIYMTDEDEREMIMLAIRYGLEPWYLIPFYCSAEGWERFQREWQELPEPADFDFVHNALCTSGKLVHVVHRQEGVRSVKR